MRVQLHLEADNLQNIAGFMKGYSDPYAVVHMQSTEESCKTEYIKNCLDPKWCAPLCLECPDDIEELNVLVEIFDHNGDHKAGQNDANHDPSDDDLMEKITFDIKPLISEGGDDGEGREFDLDGGGKLKVHAVVSKKTDEQLVFQLRAMNLKNVEKGFLGLGRTDPYFEIAKKYPRPMIGSPRLQPVYRSRVLHNHLNPVWEKAAINIEHLCDGDENMQLVITVFDGTEENTNFVSKLFTRETVGSVEILLRDLLDNVVEDGNGDLTNAFHLKRPDRSNVVGNLLVLEAERI